MNNEPEADPCIERWSLTEEAEREARFECWIRSFEAGRDVSDTVMQNWVHDHWAGFLRTRWLDHMLGIKYWSELKRCEFGLLLQIPSERRCLLNEIVAQLRCGAENLDIIRWARKHKSPEELLIVLDLLLIIDVNSRRMRCHFANS